MEEEFEVGRVEELLGVVVVLLEEVVLGSGGVVEYLSGPLLVEGDIVSGVVGYFGNEVLLVEVLDFRVSPSDEGVVEEDHTRVSRDACRSVESEGTVSPLHGQQLAARTLLVVTVLVVHQRLTGLNVVLHYLVIE